MKLIFRKIQRRKVEIKDSEASKMLKEIIRYQEMIFPDTIELYMEAK